MKIYTKTGDDGYTGLFFGGRVRKNDVRCEANGSIDETVSALGLARAFCKNSEVCFRPCRTLYRSLHKNNAT